MGKKFSVLTRSHGEPHGMQNNANDQPRTVPPPAQGASAPDLLRNALRSRGSPVVEVHAQGAQAIAAAGRAARPLMASHKSVEDNMIHSMAGVSQARMAAFSSRG